MIKRTCTAIALAAAVVCLLFIFDRQACAQVAPSASPTPAVCDVNTSRGVIQLAPDPAFPNKPALAYKRFYVSPTPFNLAANANFENLRSLSSYYAGIGASRQFIAWLKENHCETIYCRELTADEVTCDDIDPKCVSEFKTAYRNALEKLNGNQELARRWLTNYGSFASLKFKTGYFEEKTSWIKSVISAIEKAPGNNSRIRSAVTDKDGVAFFYNLCPGSYYVSSVAPLEIGSDAVLWESVKQIELVGSQSVIVRLAFPPGENTSIKKIFGKKITLK